MTTSKGPWSYDAESGYVTTKDTTGDWTPGTPEDAGLPPSFTVVCMPEMLDGISNGDLIAAAPEMRDALRIFIRYEQAMDADDHIAGMLAYAEFQAAARVALAKAER